MTIQESVKTPQEIVAELDKHIIGQDNAKRAVAIALRNRYRRKQVAPPLQNEITPKNILMIGPTGVGKTEVARRLAKLANAPFIKIEATKFTEVGYVGRDAESIIRDLAEMSVKLTRDEAREKVLQKAKVAAEDRILDKLLPGSEFSDNASTIETREIMRGKYRNGELNDKEIEIEVSQTTMGVEIMAPPGMEEMTSQLQNMFQSISGGKTRIKKMTVADATQLLIEEEAQKLINEDEIKTKALARVEQDGIVFLDEIDKVTSREKDVGNVSREGVQRDLLPIIEGSTVSTRYGMIKTDHILFIASGAFHLSKPSDLIPELQGRLPIRVELDALSTDDFVKILTEPSASLTEQYKALLKTEGVDLQFSQDGIQEIANIAWQINERTENIGARRLHTVMERLLEEASFAAPSLDGDEKVMVDANYVKQQLQDIIQDDDLSRFIL